MTFGNLLNCPRCLAPVAGPTCPRCVILAAARAVGRPIVPRLLVTEGLPPLLTTPHIQRWCERHDGPAVTRAEDAVCCEHHDTEDGVPGYCCWCGAEGEWPA